MPLLIAETLILHSVKQYVEAMENATSLLDLLSVAGVDEVEPTNRTAAREFLYSEVWSH